jgi:hypothetical protein
METFASFLSLFCSKRNKLHPAERALPGHQEAPTKPTRKAKLRAPFYLPLAKQKRSKGKQKGVPLSGLSALKRFQCTSSTVHPFEKRCPR